MDNNDVKVIENIEEIGKFAEGNLNFIVSPKALTLIRDSNTYYKSHEKLLGLCLSVDNIFTTTFSKNLEEALDEVHSKEAADELVTLRDLVKQYQGKGVSICLSTRSSTDVSCDEETTYWHEMGHSLSRYWIYGKDSLYNAKTKDMNGLGPDAARELIGKYVKYYGSLYKFQHHDLGRTSMISEFVADLFMYEKVNPECRKRQLDTRDYMVAVKKAFDSGITLDKINHHVSSRIGISAPHIPSKREKAVTLTKAPMNLVSLKKKVKTISEDEPF